jgi:hypothetical protein
MRKQRKKRAGHKLSRETRIKGLKGLIAYNKRKGRKTAGLEKALAKLEGMRLRS